MEFSDPTFNQFNRRLYIGTTILNTSTLSKMGISREINSIEEKPKSLPFPTTFLQTATISLPLLKKAPPSSQQK